MYNPFDGLPRQEAQRQAIEDSIESNEQKVLSEKAYAELEDILCRSSNFSKVRHILNEVGLGREAWNEDERLAQIRATALAEGVPRDNLENIKSLLRVTNYENVDWDDFDWEISTRYAATLRDYDDVDDAIAAINNEAKFFGHMPNWRGDLRVSLMRRYGHYLYNGEYDQLGKLHDATGVAPDWRGDLKEDAISASVRNLESGYFVDVKRIQQITGVAPDWDGEHRSDVMTAYKSQISRRRLDNLSRIEASTGVAPDWEGALHGEVVTAYGSYLEDGAFDNLMKLKALSGITPDCAGKLKPKLFKYYEHCLSFDYWDGIENAQKITGVSPDWNDEKLASSLNKKYERYLLTDCFSKLDNLQKLTGVVPDWAGSLRPAVEDKYVRYIRAGYLSELTLLQRLSGVEADWESKKLRSAVMSAYGRDIDQHSYENIAELQAFSGIAPDWEGELKPRIMKKYARNLENAYFGDIERLQSVTGVAPDWEGELRPAVMSKYKVYIVTDADFSKITNLQQLTGVAPDWNGEFRPVIMERYFLHLAKDVFTKINKIKELTGVEPDWQGELKPQVEKRYAEYLSNRAMLGRLQQLQELSGVAPNWEDMQFNVEHAYGMYIGALDLAKIKQLTELSGIAPDWQRGLRDLVVDAYNSAVIDGRLLAVGRLREITNVAPDWEAMRFVVQDAYIERLDAYEYAALAELRELSGIEPDLDRDNGRLRGFLLRRYRTLLRSNDYDGIAKLQKIPGFAPDWQGELKDAVADGYERLISFELFNYIETLQKLSGIVPDWEGRLKQLVVEEYTSNIRIGVLGPIQKLQGLSGIAPDWEGALHTDLMEAYDKFIKGRRLDKVKEWQKATGIVPDWEGENKAALKEAYGFCAAQTMFETISSLQEYSGVAPDWEGELKEVLMKAYKDGIMQGSLDPLKRLVEVTGVVPDWQGSLAPVVVDAYFLRLSHAQLSGIVDLQQFSGIAPDWQGVLRVPLNRAYDYCLTHGFLDEIKQLQKMSGIAADWSGSLETELKGKYSRYLLGGQFDKIADLQEISGIAPDWQGELRFPVRARYASLVTLANFGDIEKLHTLSGIAPDWQGELKPVVLDKYRAWVRSLHFAGIAELQQLSGIVPDWEEESMRDAVIAYCGAKTASGSPEEIAQAKKVVEVSGVDFSNEAVWQMVFARYLFEGRSFDVELLQNELGDMFTDNREVYVKVLREMIESDVFVFDSRINALDMDALFGKLAYVFEQFGLRPSDESIRHLVYLHLKNKKPLTGNIKEFLENFSVDIELQPEEIKNLSNLTPSAQAAVLSACMPKRKDKRAKVREKIKNNPAVYLTAELLKVRGLAARAEFCPWRKQVDPLIKNLLDQNAWPEHVVYEGALVFTRRFGMMNLPKISEVAVDLTAYGRSFSDSRNEGAGLRNSTIRMLESFWQAHGIERRIDFIKSPVEVEMILNEMEEIANELRESVLYDELPAGLEGSDIDLELFNTLLPRSGTYGSMEDRAALIAQWRETVKDPAVRSEVPEYFRFAKVQSAKIAPQGIKPRIRRLEGEDAAKLKAEMISEIDEKKESLLKQNPLEDMLAPMQDALVEITEIEEEQIVEPGYFFGMVGSKLEQEIKKAKEQLNAADQTQEKKIVGIRKKIEKLEKEYQRLQDLSSKGGIGRFLSEQAESLADKKPEKSLYFRWLADDWEKEEVDNYQKVQTMLEVLVALYGERVLKEARIPLYMGVAYLMRAESPGHFENVMVTTANAKKGELKEEVVEAWSNWYQDELLQHFLDQEHANEVRSNPFSDELLKMVEKVLHVPADKEQMARDFASREKDHKHPLVMTVNNIKALNKKLDRVLEGDLTEEAPDGEEVMFYPGHGLTRIFCGDIANACFDKERRNFAKGKLPNLDTVNFVSKKRGSFEVLGNVLFINTRNDKDENVLLVRALNPLEPVIQRRLDPTDFFLKVIEYAKKVAKNGNFHEVDVCVGSKRGTDGTNRQAQYDAMDEVAKVSKWEIATPLVRSPETNFNSYSTWNTTSNRVYRVWRREEDL